MYSSTFSNTLKAVYFDHYGIKRTAYVSAWTLKQAIDKIEKAEEVEGDFAKSDNYKELNIVSVVLDEDAGFLIM